MYEKEVNKSGARSKILDMSLSVNSNVTGRDASLPHYRFYELEPAIVVGYDDKTFENGAYMGYAKVRPIYSFKDVPENNLPIAIPIDSNIKDYPLKGEVVIVAIYGGVMYYMRRVNVSNSINANIAQDNTDLSKADDNTKNYQATAAGNANANATSKNATSPGKYFKVNNSIKSLLPLEGDIIFEGRFGNSIRFGGTVSKSVKISSKFSQSWATGIKDGSPIVIIRNGQREDANSNIDGTTIEDINKDASSIYLTSDQTISLLIASKNQKSFDGSAPSKYDGKQIIITSDRLIFNAKKEEILLFAMKSIGLSTNKSLNFDAGENMTVNAKKINLGLKAKEPMIKGKKLVTVLKKLLNALQSETHPVVSLGSPTGPPINATVYASIMNDLEDVLSDVTFTE